MICQDCGRANPEEAVFCAGCGHSLSVAGFGAFEEPARSPAALDEVPVPTSPAPAPVPPVSAPVVPAPVQTEKPRRPIKPVVWIAVAVVLLGVLAFGVPPVVREVRFRMAAAALRDADWSGQAAAAEWLAESEDPRAIPLLAQAMADDDIQVRVAAQDGLLSFGPAALDSCIALLSGGDPAARLGAIEVARRLDDARCVAPMCTILNDDANDAATRARAIQAVSVLGVSTGDSSPVPHLVRAISDEDEEVRIAAIKGLADFRDDSAVEPLVTCLASGGGRTCDAAAEALEAIGNPSVYPLMCSTANPSTASQALAVVRRIGPDAADQVVQAIEHPNTRVRRAAIETIVDYGYSEDPAVEALLARAREDRVVAVRIAAMNALGRFKADAASDYLFTILFKSRNKALRASAAGALVKIEGTGDRVLYYALRDRSTKAVAKYYKRFIRWGRPETLPIMRDALLKHGGKTMALAYLNSGNSQLYKAAKTWGSRRGLRVVHGSGGSWSGARWGGY